VAPRPALAGGDGTSSGKAAAATEPSASASYGPDGRASLRQRLWCSSSCGGKEPRFAGIGPSWRGRVAWLVTPQPEKFRAPGRPSRTGCLPPPRQQLRPCAKRVDLCEGGRTTARGRQTPARGAPSSRSAPSALPLRAQWLGACPTRTGRRRRRPPWRCTPWPGRDTAARTARPPPPPCPNSQRGKDSAPCGSYTLGCLCKHGVTCNMHMHMHVVVPCAACLELDTLNPGGSRAWYEAQKYSLSCIGASNIFHAYNAPYFEIRPRAA
jgi:hypothetical protein